jgi:uncharacterized protein (DUF885 family)
MHISTRLVGVRNMVGMDALDDGVWSLPDGEEYYRRCLVLHTSTNMTPDEIHQIGIDQVSHHTHHHIILLYD